MGNFAVLLKLPSKIMSGVAIASGLILFLPDTITLKKVYLKK